ncbi:mandelate racemase [Dyella monticola]|uniref:Mandelate racemase n=1 Tax=Dyella monticola TaxID=1927958 RepID=A0A370WTG1_9GAMM|nr:enolase C-terminal domain-like protein [Dyella monticola]RDS79316.1 mandelate racemase [Dyella monticola]
MTGTTARIDRVDATAYTVPTDAPEADGTISWDSTTIVIATLRCDDYQGLGYTYTHAAAASLIAKPLSNVLNGADPMDIPQLWEAMRRSLRNIGCPGVGWMAMSAVDHALWDLKAKLLGVSVTTLLGCARERVPVYGSGGFTSYTIDQLQTQLAGYVEQGIARVKMKVGTHPDQDARRVFAAREAIGEHAPLMVDANGAYTRKQALTLADTFAECNVDWFEEPVSSDDLQGLALVRNHLRHMDVAAGEYGWDTWYFNRMLDAGAVDVLQIDGTRCGGFTGFMQAASVAQAHGIPISAHCAPHLHAHVCCAVPGLRHLEYFHDHARIESMFFDGLPQLRKGALVVDVDRAGLGLILKKQDIEEYRVAS